MPAPTGPGGANRALKVFLGLSATAVILVVVTRNYTGSIAAGLLYLIISVVAPLIGLYVAAEY